MDSDNTELLKQTEFTSSVLLYAPDNYIKTEDEIEFRVTSNDKDGNPPLTLGDQDPSIPPLSVPSNKSDPFPANPNVVSDEDPLQPFTCGTTDGNPPLTLGDQDPSIPPLSGPIVHGWCGTPGYSNPVDLDDVIQSGEGDIFFFADEASEGIQEARETFQTDFIETRNLLDETIIISADII